MASAARMVLKPSSHSSITGRRRCSHSNVAGGWTLLRTLGAPLTVARCSSSPRRCDSCELHHAGLTRNGLVSRACGTLADERGPERDSCASPEVTALSPFRVTYSWTHPTYLTPQTTRNVSFTGLAKGPPQLRRKREGVWRRLVL